MSNVKFFKLQHEKRKRKKNLQIEHAERAESVGVESQLALRGGRWEAAAAAAEVATAALLWH